MILLRQTQGLLTLQGLARKQGRHPLIQDLDEIGKGVMAFDSKGQIHYCGELDKLPRPLFKQITKELSAHNQYVLPGFIECHTHSLFVGSRAHELDLRNQGLSYSQISQQGGGIQSSVEALKKSPSQHILAQAKQHLLKFFLQGVTTIEVKTGYGLDVTTEQKLVRILNKLQAEVPFLVIKTFLGAHALPKNQTEWAQHLKNLKLLLPKIRNQIDRVDIFVDTGFCPLAEARDYLLYAQSLGLPITLHAEQLSASGAADLGLELGAQSLDHLIHITDDTIKKLAQSSSTGVLLPIADLYLKCPYPPARALLDQGCRIALSTDFNPGTSPSQSLNLVGALARIEMKMQLAEVIAGFTLNAAYALGLENKMGSLEPGKWANFILIDQDWRDLFYSPDPLWVQQSYSRGQAWIH